MNYTRRQIEHIMDVTRESERQAFQRYLGQRYDELTELSNSVRDTDPARYDYVETRMGELMTIFAWVLERGEA